MKMWWLLGPLLLLLLLLWTAIERVNGEITPGSFLRDLIATFRLTSPTIVYDTDEPPEICYTDQWLLCLSSKHPPQSNPVVELVLDTENCITVAGPDPGKKCIFPFNRFYRTYRACTNRGSRGARMYCPTDIERPYILENNETASNVDVWQAGKWGYCGPECPMEGEEHHLE